ELVLVLPFGHVVRDEGAGGVFHGAFSAVLVSAGLVGQDERVLAVFMLEEVKDTLFFHKAADEVEVGLPVLHTIIALSIAGIQLKLVIREAEILEYLFNDLRRRLLLEDAAVGGARQEPQPGHHLGAVAAHAAETEVTRREAAYKAVEVTERPFLPVNGE